MEQLNCDESWYQIWNCQPQSDFIVGLFFTTVYCQNVSILDLTVYM